MNLENPRYAIIDIETTGGISTRDKITEIGIIVYQEGKIIDQFQSLINPERSIPPEITRITGITNDMVEDAPKFYEIAKDIILKTEGCIFVAHNVHFDYGFIKHEFHQLGYTFSRKRLCTLQLSRRLFKGLKSYSLGNLIQHFEIEVKDRHRAMEDAKATLILLQHIMRADHHGEFLDRSIPDLLVESKLPPGISPKTIQGFPEFPGVYYMLDHGLKPIYIGKSKNIRDRIFQHFNDTSQKTRKMLQSVSNIDFLLTGNELMACLLEADEIKKYQPEINKALRKKSHNYLLVASRSKDDYMRFKIKETEWLEAEEEVIYYYPTRQAARTHVDTILESYRLCPKINDNIELQGPCQSYQIAKCNGACISLENLSSYNERFQEAVNDVNCVFKENFLVIGQGIQADEKSVILVENGFCSFTGYINHVESFMEIESMKDKLKRYKGTIETNRIISYYLNKSKEYKVIKL